MSDAPDTKLLEQFARNQSETAFAGLVQRHIGLVYSTAFRKIGNPQHAEDITQAVFIILARKADSLSPKIVLPGWLYHTTRLTAANFQRAEIRRFRRELEVFMQFAPPESSSDAVWRELSPLLEDAMAGLGASDRDAIVLRYFQNRSLADVGAALGASEAAAKMRVSRALEKLRKYFTKRGVIFTTAIIAGAISSNSVQAAPALLAKTVTTLAIAKGATASVSTLTLAKGALKVMAWTKTQTAIAAGVAVLLAVGIVTVGVKEYQDHRTEAWELPPFPDTLLEEPAADERLRNAPSELRIAPSRYDKQMFYFYEGGGYTYVMAYGVVTNNYESWKAMGVGLPLDSILRLAYATERVFPESYGTESVFPEPWRTVYRTDIPVRPLFDYISTLPNSSSRPLQELITKKFGITAKWELIETNVLALRVLDTGLRGFHPAGSLLRSQNVVINNANQRMNYTNGWLHNSVGDSNGIVSVTFFNSSVNTLVLQLEGTFQIPIVNETELTNRYDYTILPPQEDLNRKVDGWGWQTAWKNALSEQFGLELVPTRAPVKMLVVEKAQ